MLRWAFYGRILRTSYQKLDTCLCHSILSQFEIARRTEIANNGMKDVEVGHCSGDAVELVHQRRLNIVEEFGAHKAWRIVRFAFQNSKNKKSVNFCLDGGSGLPKSPLNKKAHG